MEAAPQVIAEKITHRLIDGEKEESFAVRLSRAGDEENHSDKNIAKWNDRHTMPGKWTELHMPA